MKTDDFWYLDSGKAIRTSEKRIKRQYFWYGAGCGLIWGWLSLAIVIFFTGCAPWV